MITANLFIHGEWQSAIEGGTREILNPGDNQAARTVTDGSARDADLAITAARKAFDEGAWPRMRAAERATCIFKLPPGLAAGNCCTLKAAEATPLTAIKLFEPMAQTGFPAGIAHHLLGPGPAVGHALAASPLVDKIAFTGGTATGRNIMQSATGNLKETIIELGGKSPNIISADADLDIAMEFAMFGIYVGQGEVCSAGSRLLLQQSLAERFLPRMAKATNKIIVGDGIWIPRPRWACSSLPATWSGSWAASKPARLEGLKSFVAAIVSPTPD